MHGCTGVIKILGKASPVVGDVLHPYPHPYKFLLHNQSRETIPAQRPTSEKARIIVVAPEQAQKAEEA